MRGLNDSLKNYWTEAEEEWNRDVERFMASNQEDESSDNERMIHLAFPICVSDHRKQPHAPHFF